MLLETVVNSPWTSEKSKEFHECSALGQLLMLVYHVGGHSYQGNLAHRGMAPKSGGQMDTFHVWLWSQFWEVHMGRHACHVGRKRSMDINRITVCWNIFKGKVPSSSRVREHHLRVQNRKCSECDFTRWGLDGVRWDVKVYWHLRASLMLCHKLFSYTLTQTDLIVGCQRTMMLRYKIFSYIFTHPWSFYRTGGEGVLLGKTAALTWKKEQVYRRINMWRREMRAQEIATQIALPLWDFTTSKYRPCCKQKCSTKIAKVCWAKSPGLSNTLAGAGWSRPMGRIYLPFCTINIHKHHKP